MDITDTSVTMDFVAFSQTIKNSLEKLYILHNSRLIEEKRLYLCKALVVIFQILLLGWVLLDFFHNMGNFIENPKSKANSGLFNTAAMTNIFLTKKCFSSSI